jgi:hypothetical protein
MGRVAKSDDPAVLRDCLGVLYRVGAATVRAVSMAASLHDRIGVTQPKAVQRALGEDLNKVQHADMTLEMAGIQLGKAIRATLTMSDTAMKEIGTPSFVSALCDGDVPDWLARLWAKPARREAFLDALMVASGKYRRTVTYEEVKTA